MDDKKKQLFYGNGDIYWIFNNVINKSCFDEFNGDNCYSMVLETSNPKELLWRIII